MKYVLFSILLLGLLFGCMSLGKNSEQAISEQTNTGVLLEGSGMGYRGPIDVQVRMSGGSIIEIVIVDSIEDRFVGGSAIEELIDMVIEYNSTDIDVISGATVTSKGFLDAVFNAIMGYE